MRTKLDSNGDSRCCAWVEGNGGTFSGKLAFAAFHADFPSPCAGWQLSQDAQRSLCLAHSEFQAPAVLRLPPKSKRAAHEKRANKLRSKSMLAGKVYLATLSARSLTPLRMKQHQNNGIGDDDRLCFGSMRLARQRIRLTTWYQQNPMDAPFFRLFVKTLSLLNGVGRHLAGVSQHRPRQDAACLQQPPPTLALFLLGHKVHAASAPPPPPPTLCSALNLDRAAFEEAAIGAIETGFRGLAHCPRSRLTEC